jgi:hypothetical protein
VRTFCLLSVLASLAVPSLALGAGLAHNHNFIVLAPDQPLAEDVLAEAEFFRKQVAKEWLGEELPPSVGPAVIHVQLSETEDSGLTWAIDSPGRKFHKLWITTTRRGALGSTLGHEITHLVLATRFPDRLPAWAEEGAASLKDDQERIELRRRIIQWYARTGNWPNLDTIFQARTVLASDQATYSVAASLTEYLLSRGDKATFLRFAVAGKEKGWDFALQQHYSVRSAHELQATWQAWVSGAKARVP